MLEESCPFFPSHLVRSSIGAPAFCDWRVVSVAFVPVGGGQIRFVLPGDEFLEEGAVAEAGRGLRIG